MECSNTAVVRVKAKKVKRDLIPDWHALSGKLWPNQSEALERLDAYLGTPGWAAGALIQMPTGSGKTVEPAAP